MSFIQEILTAEQKAEETIEKARAEAVSAKARAENASAEMLATTRQTLSDERGTAIKAQKAELVTQYKEIVQKESASVEALRVSAIKNKSKAVDLVLKSLFK